MNICNSVFRQNPKLSKERRGNHQLGCSSVQSRHRACWGSGLDHQNKTNPKQPNKKACWYLWHWTVLWEDSFCDRVFKRTSNIKNNPSFNNFLLFQKATDLLREAKFQGARQQTNTEMWNSHKRHCPGCLAHTSETIHLLKLVSVLSQAICIQRHVAITSSKTSFLRNLTHLRQNSRGDLFLIHFLLIFITQLWYEIPISYNIGMYLSTRWWQLWTSWGCVTPAHPS